jgi:hypothetical protein
MMRRTPMKRGTGFKRPEPTLLDKSRAAQRAASIVALLATSGTPSVMGGTTSGEPVEKDNPVRSESYRRLVASMPCCWCRREGMSQAAHPNHGGKGMALKVDDRRCFALCFTCHAEFDQGTRLTREQRRSMADTWEAQTRRDITAAGRWPSNLPRWTEE